MTFDYSSTIPPPKNKMLHAILLALLLVILGLFWLTILPRPPQNNAKNGRKLPPGPRALPVIGNLHMLTTLPHRGLQDLARKYGPIMSLRLGQVPAVVISSPEAAELFLKTHDIVFANRPIIQASEYLSYGSKGMVFTKYGPYWRNVRKLCTLQLLSASKIESFTALRREEVRSFVEWLRKAAAAGEVVDVSAKVGELIEDITYKIILGRDKDEKHDLKGIIEESTKLIGAFNLADYVPYLGPLDLQGLTRRLKKLSKAVDQVMENIIVEHEQAASEQQGHKDFVDVLLSLMDQQDEYGNVIDRENIKAILLEMVVGAFDTASTSISWSLSELLRNPRIMKNLQEELQCVIGMNKMVEEKDLGKLDYLNMVITESIRLHPVAPLIVPREAREDITIEEFYIPKKSRIIVNTWAIGRDPNVWSENVEEFYPERFIDSNIDLRGNDFRLLPFGSGRRGCPGIGLGLVTIRFVLAQLVHCFRWDLPSGMKPDDIDMTETFGLSMGRANLLLAKPTYRLLA